MSKKNFSVVVALVLFTSVFGVLRIANAAPFTTPQTSTSISNLAPVFTVQPNESWTQAYANDSHTDARAESSATYPTNVGTDLTISATATDANGDDYYLIVCKDAVAATPGNFAAPTCSSLPNTWAVGADTTQGSGTSVTFSTTGLTNETYSWYAYACDKVQGGGLCTLATSSQGGTLAEAGSPGAASGSPFHVNHRPVMGTLNSISVAPGTTLNFKLAHSTQVSDPDTNASQNTVTLYVCTPETTTFDYYTNTCTGGAVVCHVDNVDPTNSGDLVNCNDAMSPKLNVIPTKDQSYNVQLFLKDNHGFEQSGGTTTQSYTITNVAPKIIDNSAYTVSGITLTAGTSTPKSYTVVVEDDNGDTDIAGVSAALYDHAVSNLLTSGLCTSASDKNCISQPTCTLSQNSDYLYATGNDHGGTAATLATATCAYTVWYDADYSTDWRMHANPKDEGAAVTDQTDSIAIATNDLAALNVAESTIAYGTLALGTSNSTGVQTTLQNYGNHLIDVLISGTDMSGTPAGTIAAGQQQWGTSSGFSYGSGYTLLNTSAQGTETNGCTHAQLAQRANHDTSTGQAEDVARFWKIQIPASQVAGSYTGTNTFASTVQACTGTN
jgi:hypothetical protein